MPRPKGSLNKPKLTINPTTIDNPTIPDSSISLAQSIIDKNIKSGIDHNYTESKDIEEREGIKKNPNLWVKGHSGNPRGRPKKGQAEKEAQKDALKLIKLNTVPAVNAILEVMKDKKTRPADRLRAAEIIIDRVYGKAPTTVTVETADTNIMDDIKHELIVLQGIDQTEEKAN